MDQTRRSTRLIGNILLFLCAFLLIGSSVAKLAHIPKVVAEMGANGFEGGKVTFVGALEILGALLLLARPTRSFGLLFVSAFLGGAIATHLQHSQSIFPPALILTLIWLGGVLRHPSAVLWSFSASRQANPTAQRQASQVVAV